MDYNSNNMFQTNSPSNFDNPFPIASQYTPKEIQMDIPQSRDISANKIKDWKKAMSDRLQNRIKKYREDRIDAIRENNEEFLEEMRIENMIKEYNDDMLLSEYFERIFTLFENEGMCGNEYEVETCLNSHLSFCPICLGPVISTEKKVLCMNLCFEYNIPQDFFNEEITLDNLMDLFSKTLKEHKGCNSEMKLLFFQNQLEVVCDKCFRQNFLF